MLALAFLIGYVVSMAEILGVLALFAILPAIAYVYFLLKYPIVGLYTALNLAFVAMGLSRYLPIPFGLVMDGIFFLTVVIVLFSSSRKDLSHLNSLPFYVFGIWFVYTIFMIFNPLAPNFLGWIYAVRGTSFNFFFIIIITLILMRDKKHLTHFIYIWMAWSVLGLLWGLKQQHIGLDGAETAWLAAGNASTHILHGQLRVFSFFSDAGQFGAAMAHASLVAFIIAIGPGSWRRRITFGALGAALFYGMMISGTRGALFVPAAGGLVYLIANRNFTILTMGLVAGALAFGMLKYTYIGHGNYEIRRLRSALDTEDASFNVRRETQRELTTYLADKPFGGGIGTVGHFGLRFSPDTYLAQTPPDSWFVRIWAETGIVGLVIHAGGLVLLIIAGFFRIFALHDPYLRNILAGLLAGYAGIIFASYGNPVFGQYPTNVVTVMSIALIWCGRTWDRQTEDSG